MDIAFLLNRLENMTETAPVVLKKNEDPPVLEEVGLLGKLSVGADAFDAVIHFLTGVVSEDSGSNAADECEKKLRAGYAARKTLTAGHCRDVLRQYALKSSDASALKKFSEQLPDGLRDSLRYDGLSPYSQLAIMLGVQKSREMMQAVAGLYEIDDGALKAGGRTLLLETVRKAQKILAASCKAWVSSMVSALPEQGRERELVLVKKNVFTILLVRHEEAVDAFLEALTTGTVADIFTLQSAAVRTFTRFAEDTALPSGIDGKGPAFVRNVVREFLFVAACRRIKKQGKFAGQEAVRAEASERLRPDPLKAMARLLTLYFNGLLSELPAEKELRPRANVKNFDVEGFHADFVRDCIAKRYSFTIENHGKLENSYEREAAVGRGKRDLEFYEAQLEEMLRNGQEDQIKKWAPPKVRTSPSMNEKDLSAAQQLAMRGIPDREMRMAITRISNQAGIALFETFFGKDPAMGVVFESTDKQMFIHFVPRKGGFSVEARVHNDSMKSLDRNEDGDDEIILGWVNFFQIEYSGVLKKEKDPALPAGVRWTICGMAVEALSANLLAPE